MTLRASCHCGRNQLEIEGEIPPAVTRCTCSLCTKRGRLIAYYAPEQLKVRQADSDGVYRWNTKLVAHHFCTACGCDLYADSPAFERDGGWDGQTRRIGLNARLIEDFEAAEWPVEVIDGRHLW